METLARPLARNKLAGPCESAARFAARCESHSPEVFFFSLAGRCSVSRKSRRRTRRRSSSSAYIPCRLLSAGKRRHVCTAHQEKWVGTEPKTFGDHAVITVLFSCPASGLQKGKRKIFSDSPCVILPVYYTSLQRMTIHTYLELMIFVPDRIQSTNLLVA